MDKKRKLAAKINEKKTEIRNLIAADKLAEATEAEKELKDLQKKYDMLDALDKEDLEEVKAQAAAGKAGDFGKKNSIVKTFVNAIRSGIRREPVSKEDMEILNSMREGSDPDGGLTVPADISTQIRELRRSEDALENEVTVENTSNIKGSRVYEVNADSVPFDTIDEESVFPDVDTPVLKKVEYAVKKFGGILKVTYELLKDSDTNIIAFLTNWAAKKCRATRNSLILKKLNEMTSGFEVEVTDVDGLKNIFNVELDPAIAAGSKIITNQSGFNWLDKLKDKDGDYILQKDPTQPTRRLLFGSYPVRVVSNRTIKNSAGKVPLYCGNLKEALVLFDRENMTIDISAEAGDLWKKDQTGIKVRERLDCQIIDDCAVVKAEIPTTEISEPARKYRRSQLEALSIEEIKKIATEKSYSITKETKEEIIEEFLKAQKG
mgnify:FL=1